MKFFILVKKEILNNLLNFRFVLVYFLCTFLIVASFAITLSDYITEKKVYDSASSIYRSNNNAGLRDYGDYWHFYVIRNVVRPPVFLKLFAVGGEKDPDSKAYVRNDINPLFRGDIKKNPLSSLFVTSDLVALIGIIASLMIIVLMYDALSGEREEGTLRLLLSCPLPRDILIAAKWVGGFISLSIPFITSWLIILIMIALNTAIQISPEEILRITLIFFLCWLFIGAVFSIAFYISTISKSSANAIIALLCFWALFIVVIPGLSTPIALQVINRPGVDTYEIASKRIGVKGNDNLDITVDSVCNAVPENMQYQYFEGGLWDQIHGSLVANSIDKMLDSMPKAGELQEVSLLRVDKLARWYNCLSPYGCLQNATVAIAGTGIKREIGLRKALFTYAKASIDYSREMGGNYDASGQPQLKYVADPTINVLKECFVEISILAGIIVSFFFLSYVSFLRKEII